MTSRHPEHLAQHLGRREGETAMYALFSTLPVARGLPRLALPPIGRWWRTRRERLQLLELNDHMLNDIGVTREEVQREAARPFWDAPLR
jgi:uncharacterized protein YjiS (DUF1127 family)